MTSFVFLLLNYSTTCFHYKHMFDDFIGLSGSSSPSFNLLHLPTRRFILSRIRNGGRTFPCPCAPLGLDAELNCRSKK